MRIIDTSRVRTRFDQRVRMSDGIELSTDLYLPPESGLYPVLLTRTPYDNNRAKWLMGQGIPKIRGASELFRFLASQGYVVAAQDVRGRGDSQGEFTPFVHEAGDGFDTISWLAGLAETDGRVGMFGSGYSAFCAWATAARRPSELLTLVSLSAFGAPFEGLPSRGGAWRLDWLLWQHMVAGRLLQPADLPAWATVWETLPIRELDDAMGREDIWWKDWLAHPEPDVFWQCLDVTETLADTDISVLHVSGWWDAQLASVRRYWDVLNSGPARDRQHLIVGPWSTESVRHPVREVGGFDFGPCSVLDIPEVLLDWFGDRFKSSDQRDEKPTVRAFKTGRNQWDHLALWPPETSEQRFYLHSGGRANTSRGDGSLEIDGPADKSAPDGYVYDPALPVMWQPNFTSFSRNVQPGFVLDQRFIEGRDDVLCFTSGPVNAPLVIAGRAQVVLYASTDAPDTDWVVLLSDVTADGPVLNLSHDILRASRIDGFQPGAFASATGILRANQQIAHDVAHPSVVILPVKSS